MKRVNKILKNKTFLENLNNINDFEKDRVYCRHSIEHLFDVARIGYIIALEENKYIDKEIIYSASILHDIGRYIEYTENVPHDLAGASISEQIMKECGYNETETKIVKNAILSHRKDENINSELGEILYRADKLSRKCFCCDAEESCYWSNEKKNLHVMI